MRNQVLYASLIFSISVLLIGAGMYSADAVKGSETVTTQGNGVDVQIKGSFQLIINPNENSKDYNLQYGFVNSDGVFERGLCLNVTDKLVKISALKKATVEFNTKDASLGKCNPIGPTPLSSEVDISVNFFNGEPKIDESNFEKGPNCDGDGFCSHEVGTTNTATGEVTAIVGDKSFEGTGKVYKHNTKITTWTE